MTEETPNPPDKITDDAHDRAAHIEKKFLTDLEINERHRRCLRLRINGHTYQQIADLLGYADHTGPRHAILTALKRNVSEPTDELRKLILMRLDKYLEELWRRRDMIIKRTVKHDDESNEIISETRLHIKDTIQTALKIEAQRAALLGLNVRPLPILPEEVLPDGTDPLTFDMEVLRARARTLTLGIQDAEEIKRQTAIRIKEIECSGDGSGEDSEGRIIDVEARNSPASGTDT